MSYHRRPRARTLPRFALAAAGLLLGSTSGGFASGPLLTITPSSISFGNQTIGTSSGPVTVTIKNPGPTKLVTIRGVGIQDPFTISGFTGHVTLTVGQQLILTVVFTPTTTGPASGSLGIFYNSALSTVPLSGSGTAVSSLTATTASPLPAATQNAAYSATLQASGGTPPYSWSLASGSSLPPGLALSSAGIISGSANAATTGNFTFDVQVSDSSAPPAHATASLTLPVAAPNGANCNQISFGSPPLVSLTDLGTGTYQGAEGGLYPNGSNVDPSDHQTAGANIAAGVQPLDGNGNPSPTGQEVLLAIGASTATDEFQQFVLDATADPSTNTHVVFVNGAEPGYGLNAIADPNNKYWANIETFLSQAKVTDKQVVAAWIEMTEAGPDLRQHPLQFASQVQAKFETIAQILTSKFANIRLAYFTTRMYAGYATTTESPEPFAYATAFAAKWAIQDQINGLPALNFDPAKGPVMAPWLAWAAYWWADGLTPRADGLVWTCQDFQKDGTHPSYPGRIRAGSPLLTFFKTDSSTTPWFLAPH